MAKVNVYNLKRESVGQIELSEEVFGAEVNEALIYDVLRHPHLVLTKDAVAALENRFQKA